MSRRTLSIRVEVVVDHDDAADLAYVREDLVRRAREAIEQSPRTVTIYEAGSVLRMPEGPRW